MTDNITAATGNGAVALPDNTIIATDNIGGVNYQRIKLTWGADGTATDASSTAALPVSVSTSTGIIGAVMPSTQWTVTTTPSSQVTVSVTPSTQFSVTTTPSSQATISVTPTTNWDIGTVGTVTTVTSITNSVGITSSTAVRGAVMPSTQWTVSVTPSTQFTVTTTPSSQATVSVTPTTQWTVANATSTGVIGAVMPSTQWTVTTTPSSAYSVNATQVTTNWSVTQGTTAWTVNPNIKTTSSYTNVPISSSSTAVGFPNILVTSASSQTIRIFRLYLNAVQAASDIRLAGSTTTSTVFLAIFGLAAGGSIYMDAGDSGEPIFVTASSGTFSAGTNASGAASQLRGFVQYTQS